MKKKDLLIYIVLGILATSSIYFLNKSSSLRTKLTQTQVQKDSLKTYLDRHFKLLEIDSIVIKGDYQTAITSYSSTLKDNKELNMVIPLRIALAEKLMKNDAKNSLNQPKGNVIGDSIKNSTFSTNEIRKIDSLNFALEKARIQLSYLRKQLKDKVAAEYINFTSKKGTALHYVGEVKNKMANGTGIAILETGSRYEGQWKDGKRDGKGTFFWPDGEYYIGQYKDDMRNGQGTYFWPNGDKYVGNWKNDKRNGEGSFYDKKGSIVTGNWVNDKLKTQIKPER